MSMKSSTASLPMRFQELWQHCAALNDEAYWETEGFGDPELEADLRAAAIVMRGGKLHKFRKSGRDKPHQRWVHVAKGIFPPSRRVQAVLHWEKKSGVVVRADDEVYESCFQGDNAPNQPGSFQIILDKRMLFFVAETTEERDTWVAGINALASKGIDPLTRDDEKLGAENASTSTSGDCIVLKDVRSGCVYLRDFSKTALTEHWIMSARAMAQRQPSSPQQGGRGGGPRMPPPLPPEALEDDDDWEVRPSLLGDINDEEDGPPPPPGRNMSFMPPQAPIMGGARQALEARARQGSRLRGASFAVEEEQRIRDEHAARMIEHAKAQAQLMRHSGRSSNGHGGGSEYGRPSNGGGMYGGSDAVDVSEEQRRKLLALEEERAQRRYEEELAAWEAQEGARQSNEATGAIQASLMTQDAAQIRAAIQTYGHVLSSGTDQARADLQLAKNYLAQLEQASADAAAQYNAAVTELHRLTYMEVDQFGAEEALVRIQEVAAQADSVGAPDDLMAAAQERANGLHAAVVELMGFRQQAEAAIHQACAQMATLGIHGIPPLQQALEHGSSLRLSGEIYEQALQYLDTVVQAENDRVTEAAAAEAALTISLQAVQRVVHEHMQSGEAIRSFEAAEALRAAVARAQAAGVEPQLIYDASNNLAPIEAAEANHKSEVISATQALQMALQMDSQPSLKTALAEHEHLRPYVSVELFEAASQRLQEFEAAQELSEATSQLKISIDTCEGGEGAAPLRKALRRAEAAGLEGLLVRKASNRLKDLAELEAAMEREAEAVRWMQQQESEKAKRSEQKRQEEEEKEKKKEQRKAEKRAEKERLARGGGGGAGGSSGKGEELAEDWLSQKAAEYWEMFTAPNGRSYYHNSATNETTWTKPAGFEEAQRKVHEAEETAAREEQRQREEDELKEAQRKEWQQRRRTRTISKHHSENPEDHAENAGGAEAAAIVAKAGRSAAKSIGVHAAGGGGVADRAQFEAMSTKKLHKYLNARGVDFDDDLKGEALIVLATRSAHLPTVIWQRAKAADGRTYYFNVKTKATSWTKPDDLGRVSTSM